MKGISSIIDHKKWVFCYFVTILITVLLTKNIIDGGQFMGAIISIITFTIGANAFDKFTLRNPNK